MNRAPTAAGCVLALLVLAGAGVGTLVDQASAGTLAGLAAGLLLALASWLLRRRRTGR